MNGQVDTVLVKGNGQSGVRNLNTIILHTTRGMVPAETVESWMGIYTKMNHKSLHLIVSGMDADEGLNTAIQRILEDKVLSTFAYVLLWDDDNIAPHDGLLRLIDRIGDYDALGGLYVTKDNGIHLPLCLGRPEEIRDWTPRSETSGIVECNGTGTGFVLVKMDVFKRLSNPWFKSVEQPEGPFMRMQHDVYFFYHMRQAGMRIAVDMDLPIGHYDVTKGVIYYPKDASNGKEKH